MARMLRACLGPAVAMFLALGGNLAVGADRDELFGDDLPLGDKSAADNGERHAGSGIRGFIQFELARTTAAPDHWSKMRTRAEVGGQGELGEGLKWKLGARLDYDAVFDATNYYSDEVARNQRKNIDLRENYLDFSSSGWDFRIGRQHVVWGEMVGFFLADVVSARDMREYILPTFDTMRIPQWAARAEYFKDDFHAELLWIPVASYDRIGKPGAEFYPYQPVPAGGTAIYRQEVRPKANADHMNYGVRLSTLKSGWDVSGFLYRSMDNSATFYRETLAPNIYAFEARHDRINQAGGTLAKDFGSVVLKGEVVYTQGRRFTVLRTLEPDGLVAQNTLDWAAGLDFTLPADSRLNVQLYQRVYFAHDPDLVSDKRENGYSIYLTRKLTDRLEAQALLISSFNRPDWLFQPRLMWNFEKNWRLLIGADIFKGPPLGQFGQYDSQDRITSEVRYSF